MNKKQHVLIDKFDNFEPKSKDVICEKFYNLNPFNSLKSSHGFEVAKFKSLPDSDSEYELDYTGIGKVNGISYFKQYFPLSKDTTHRLLVHGEDKKLYINQLFCDFENLIWIYNLRFDSPPITLTFKQNDLDTIILSSDEKMIVWKTDFSPYQIENAPIITSMCINDNVLFCSIKDTAFKVWYCTDLNAENIGMININSGYISLDDSLGDAKKVITFDEDVYVFREYGISKIKYLQNNITVSHVYQTNTRIYENSVAVCGDKLIFMTKDGIYSFNGVKVNKINKDICKYLTDSQEFSTASSLGEFYYVALNLNFNDDKNLLCETQSHNNNAVIILNITDLSYEIIRGVDINTFLPLKTPEVEKMLVIYNSQYDFIGQICTTSQFNNTQLQKFWQSGEINTNNQKRLYTKLLVNSSANVIFKLIYNDKEFSITTYQEGINEFNFKICTDSLKLVISSEQNNCKVDSVYLEYYEDWL